MTRKIIALSIIIIVLASTSACASSKAAKKEYIGRDIPSDPTLPSYENPQEIDIKVKKKKLHISFKGVFRGIDDSGRLTDWVYFAFTAQPQDNMYFAVGQTELFDSHAKVYRYHAVPRIGTEHVFGRNIVGGITVPVLVGVNMPIAEAGEFPTISQVTIMFNKKAFQYRNIVVEDWETYEGLSQENTYQD